MHLRISAVLYFAILAGLATSTQLQSNSNRYRWTDQSDNIDIDGELEGSGGGTEVSRDLEASGSGYGPDDEDSTEGGTTEHINHPTLAVPAVPNLNQPEDELTKHTGPSGVNTDHTMSSKPEERPTSFFAQPGILAAVVGGAVVGLLCAILVVMFIVYRMRKKDEGSYPLDEQKRPSSNNYRGNNKEFYA